VASDRSIDGYELLHSQESLWSGGRTSGIKIFAKDSARAFVDEDHTSARRAGDELVKKMELTAARLDPEGPGLRAKLRMAFIELYARVGEKAIYVEEVPNQYGGSDPFYYHRPWFRITSRIGHVLIGWRKSVINIDWSDTVVAGAGKQIFPDEDVTRGETWGERGGRFIHAYGYENAERYLKRLHDVADAAARAVAVQR